MAADNKALLVLEDGTVHRGVEYGAVGQTRACGATAVGAQDRVRDRGGRGGGRRGGGHRPQRCHYSSSDQYAGRKRSHPCHAVTVRLV